MSEAQRITACDGMSQNLVRESGKVWIKAGSFGDFGGWVIDQQAMDVMGAPFLMAHGLGRPVADATTNVIVPQPGEYRVWVRTRDWVGPWKGADVPEPMRAVGSPGQFQVSVGGQALARIFGMEGADWHWEDGGTVEILDRTVQVALHDLTGFNGRCEAILLSLDHQFIPPEGEPEMCELRKTCLGHLAEMPVAGDYDLVVVGGGIAGVCAAISAARHGCRVALLHDRPVLGGNNSSEVRVGLSGLIHQEPYPRLGDLVDEIGPIGHWNLWEAKQRPEEERSQRILEVIEKHPEKKIHNAGPVSNYEDQRKIDAVLAEENVSLFLNTHVNDVTMDDAETGIAAVVGQDIRTGDRQLFRGRLFADCTGDANVGFLAGAEFREGREARKQTDESLAPEHADRLVMGTSVQWYAVKDQPSTFPECPWTVRFDADTCVKTVHGDWDWETGADRNQVTDVERIRDYALRVVFGNWTVLKNHPQFRDEFVDQRLEWVAYIGGKRESRRLLGDVILAEQDVVEQKPYPDACVTTTWTIDLHYPREPDLDIEPFRSEARHLKIEPYPIPFRCLYSRNVPNLMMAGRNISVTHVALGTVRVMRTTGMMGEVLGMAAGICTKHACNPRRVYTDHLGELKEFLAQGIPPRR